MTRLHTRTRPEDFRVEERPAHAPTGSGQHLWLWIEKRGLGTQAALGRLARVLDVPRRRLRTAGLKDARAVTRQWVSVDRPPADAEARLAGLEARGEAWVAVRDASRSRRGLSRGQLLGNGFVLRLRPAPGDTLGGTRGGTGDRQGGADRDADVPVDLTARAEVLGARLAELAVDGVPNRFGPQRFGVRGDSARAGEALLRGRHDEAASLVLGRPGPADRGRILAAREAFEAGDLAAAREAWPRDQAGPRRLLTGLLGGATAEAAWRRVDRPWVQLLGAAWQAERFNVLLDRRMAAPGGLAGLLPGDLALRLPLGRKAFPVEDLAAEQARADRLEVTASGPLFGPHMPWPGGAAGDLEREVLAAGGWAVDELAGPTFAAWPGGRRGLRMALTLPDDGPAAAAGADEHGPYVELRFDLPKGGYATTVLAELGLEDRTAGPGVPERAPTSGPAPALDPGPAAGPGS